MQRSASYVLSTLLTLFALALPALSQTGTGSLRGIVTDPSKAILTGAKVTLINKENGAERTAQSNSAGEYQFSAVQPGEYEIKVTMQGFKSQITPRHPAGRRKHHQ